MSKKKNGKKNQDFEDDDNDFAKKPEAPGKAVKKGKKGKKGKNDDDWSGDDEIVDVVKKAVVDDDSDGNAAPKSKGKKNKSKSKKKINSDDDEDQNVRSISRESSQVSAASSNMPKAKKGGNKKGGAKSKDDWSDDDKAKELELKVEMESENDEPIAVSKKAPKKKAKKAKKMDDTDDEDISAEEDVVEEKDNPPKDSEKEVEEHEEEEKEDVVAELGDNLEKVEITGEDAGQEKRVTNKEKKKLKKQQEWQAQMEILTKKGGQGSSDLGSNFTMSQVHKSGAQKTAMEHAVDIKIENFTISAKGNDLFVNANLLIAQGRRYGLVGPNGHGKTTLLRHLSSRAFAIPPNIDVLLCEQEVVADSNTAVQTILNADVKRTNLMNECKDLENKFESESIVNTAGAAILNFGSSFPHRRRHGRAGASQRCVQ